MRQRILEATERVLRAKGLAGATTRQIAREVGCADGTLYVHFRDRTDLFLALLDERLPEFTQHLRHLPNRVGRRGVRGNLEEVATAALDFYEHVTPLFAGLLSEPALLVAHRTGLRDRQGGPQRSHQAVAGYLRGEQKEGRVNSGADPEMAAAMLLNACFGRIFSQMFIGEERSAEDDARFVKKLVAALWRGLAVPSSSNDE